jgi:hypothetical protein
VSDRDKAAAERLTEGQKKVVKTVETASKETAKEEKKAEAATAPMAKQTEAAPPPPAAANTEAPAAAAAVTVGVGAPAANDKEVLQKAAEAAARSLKALETRRLKPRSIRSFLGRFTRRRGRGRCRCHRRPGGCRRSLRERLDLLGRRGFLFGRSQCQDRLVRAARLSCPPPPLCNRNMIAIALRNCNLVSPARTEVPSVLNTANVGWFSSDRTIAEYAKEIWNAPFAPIS